MTVPLANLDDLLEAADKVDWNGVLYNPIYLGLGEWEESTSLQDFISVYKSIRNTGSKEKGDRSGPEKG